MRLWIGLASVVGAALFVVAASAVAAPPDHFTDSGSYTGNASCGSFTNFWSGSFAVSGKTMLDKAGNPVKDVVHQSGSELNWRSGSDASYTVYFDFNIVYDYATDTTSLNGKVIKVNYPGLGVLFQDVGKIVFVHDEVTTVHGPHDTFEQGQDAYCNAFLAIAGG